MIYKARNFSLNGLLFGLLKIKKAGDKAERSQCFIQPYPRRKCVICPVVLIQLSSFKLYTFQAFDLLLLLGIKAKNLFYMQITVTYELSIRRIPIKSTKKAGKWLVSVTTSLFPASLVLPSNQMCPYQVVPYSIFKSESHCLPLSGESMPPNTSLTAKPFYNGCISSLSLLSCRLPCNQTDAVYIYHNEK